MSGRSIAYFDAMTDGARRKDILLVDDDPAALAMLELALRRADFSVVACPTPAAALEELGRRKFR